VCLTLGPAFISAAIYLCLARIVIVYGKEFSRLKPRTYGILFATCDLVALLLQSGGGALAVSADTKSASNAGIYIMLGGLAFQALSLVLFMTLWLKFFRRRRRAAAAAATRNEVIGNPEFADLRQDFKFKAFQIGMSILILSCVSRAFTGHNLTVYIIALLTAAICITLRSFYRLVELEGGFDSAAANNQPAFMVLEGPMIIIAVTALAIFHPGYGFNGRWADANWTFRQKTKESVGV
jgi:RTA1 like protein